jgi:hypothetical protein
MAVSCCSPSKDRLNKLNTLFSKFIIGNKRNIENERSEGDTSE